MFRKYFAVCLAVCFSFVTLTVLLLDTPVQGQNYLVPAASAVAKPAADTAKLPPSAAVVAEPDYPDPTTVKTLSDKDLNKLFDRMSTHYSKDAVLFNNIGAAYFERKDYANAEASIRRAIILNDHPAFLTNLSIIYDTQSRYSEALSAAQRAVDQAPRYVRGKVQLCELLLLTKRDADAVLCYNELAKITTLDEYSQTLDAIAYQRTGNADKVIAMMEPLVRQSNATGLMFNTLGYAYFMKKRYREAVDAFRQAVESEPDSSALRYNLAIALDSVNDHDGALMQYSLIKTSDPQRADALLKGLTRNQIIYVDTAAARTKH